MLRRTVSSLTSSSDNKISIDQENEFNFDSSAQNLPTPSPNRSKYEGKFGKRRPLGEKTNKNSEKSSELKESSCKREETKEEDGKREENKDKKSEDATSNTTNASVPASNVSFQDLFHLHENHPKSDSNSFHRKIEELSMALSETLQENEQLNDTVSLLKAEVDRLNGELLEFKEYAELYLLSKELIEHQSEEIENLKLKLVKRGD